MSRSLPRHLKEFADKAVADGAYPDTDAVIEAGVARLADEAAERAWLRAKLDEVADDPVLTVTREELLADFEARVAARQDESA